MQKRKPSVHFVRGHSCPRSVSVLSGTEAGGHRGENTAHVEFGAVDLPSRSWSGPVWLGSSGLGRDRVGSGRAGLDWILCSRLPDWRRLDSARRERCGTRAQAPDLGDAAAGRPAAENRLDGDEKHQADLPERMRGAGSGRAALRVWLRSAEVCVCCMWWWLEVLETRRSSPGPGRRFEVCSHPPGATQPDSNAVQAGAPQQPQQPNQA